MNRKQTFIICISWIIFIRCSSGKKQNFALQNLDNEICMWVDSGYYNGVAVSVVKDGSVIFKSFYGGYTDTTALHVASAGKWVAAATIAAIVDEGKRRDDYQTLEEAVANILPLSVDTLPGTTFRYGGLAMQVAGRMAEIATGKKWETLFQEKIGRPLNMKSSFFVPVSEEGGFSPMLGGGFKTCLHDYMNFLNMISNNGLYKGKRILTSESIEEIEKDQVGKAIINAENFVLRSRQNLHNGIYGLGIWREEIDKNGKATLVSSPGWAGSYPWVDRKNNIYGFIIAKVNGKALSVGFSSFYESAKLSLMVRDVIKQTSKSAPDSTKRSSHD